MSFISSGNSSANQDNADPISEALLGTGRSTPTPSPTLQPSSVSDRERELQEQDELQMALAISLSEQKVNGGFLLYMYVNARVYMVVLVRVCVFPCSETQDN